MTEGAFPKIDGDILYASEANRFNPKVIGQHEQYALVNGSGTNFVLIGSVTYNATPSPISSFLCISTAIGKQENAINIAARLRISGAGVNMVTATKNNDGGTNGQGITIVFNHILTSGALTASGGNVGSNYIISVEEQNNQDTPNIWANDMIVWGF